MLRARAGHFGFESSWRVSAWIQQISLMNLCGEEIFHLACLLCEKMGRIRKSQSVIVLSFMYSINSVQSPPNEGPPSSNRRSTKRPARRERRPSGLARGTRPGSPVGLTFRFRMRYLSVCLQREKGGSWYPQHVPVQRSSPR